jgi:hypothetical protein
MRVTLNQDELFEAISSFVSNKFSLDSAAKIEISLTAGRSPKGYTADVDITYPKSEMASKITARDPDVEPAETVAAASFNEKTAADTQATPDATAGGAVNPNNLFDAS